MKKLLHIICSPRGSQSRTLKISNHFIDGIMKTHPNIEIDELNLFAEQLPEMDITRVGGKYMLMSGEELTPEAEKSWEQIKEHIARFLSAEIIIVSTPMWNFSVPYKMKHYLDVILQPGFMFKYGPNGPEGLAGDRKLFVVSTHGGDYKQGSPASAFDQLTPYLKQVFGFMGITDLNFVSAQPMDAGGPEARDKSLTEAMEKVNKHVLSL